MIDRASRAIEDARDQLRRQARFDWIETYCTKELEAILAITRSAEQDVRTVIHTLKDMR